MNYRSARVVSAGVAMIVWVASFPRSGNTFFRIVLNRLYGVRTSVVYDIDGVAARVGGELIGFEERPASYEAMRASDAVHFVKTHRQRDEAIHEDDRVICLVRDGRDALVSWARMNSEADPAQYRPQLRAMITRQSERGTGGWGANVLSWLRTRTPDQVVLRYDEVIADPSAASERAMCVAAPQVERRSGASLPSFADLQKIDGRFFRRGLTGSHRDELPEDLQDLFWSQPENRAAMDLLGLGGPA